MRELLTVPCRRAGPSPRRGTAGSPCCSPRSPAARPAPAPGRPGPQPHISCHTHSAALSPVVCNGFIGWHNIWCLVYDEDGGGVEPQPGLRQLQQRFLHWGPQHHYRQIPSWLWGTSKTTMQYNLGQYEVIVPWLILSRTVSITSDRREPPEVKNFLSSLLSSVSSALRPTYLSSTSNFPFEKLNRWEPQNLSVRSKKTSCML